MRAWRFLALAVVIVIAIVIIVASVLPGFTDWNRYRGSLELLAGEALGRPVTIAGPVSLSVLPEPVLTASRVSVGGRGARITIGELRLRVASLPLLAGEVDARSLTLRHPVFHLDWPPWRGMALAAPSWPTALSARIEDGEIDAGGIVLRQVDATLVAGEGHAALTLVGSAAIGPSTWSLDLKLSQPGSDGTAAFEANLQSGGSGQGIAAKITGRLQSDGGLAGQIALDGSKLSDLMAAPPLPFHADGRFTLTHAAIRLAGVEVTFGSVSAHGVGTLSLVPGPRLDLVLASENTVPLDPWLAVLRRGGESRMPVGLSFSAPRATLARGLLRHLDLAVVLGPDGARIGAFRATLPGDAVLAAEGRIVRSGPVQSSANWQFEGTAHLAAPALLATIHWLDAAAPGVLPPLPAAALGEAQIGGRVVIRANGIALDDLKGAIGHSKVTGSLSLGLGGRPAISAGLQLDQLDLGPWLPRGFLDAPRGRGFPIAKIPALFKGITLELRLTAGRATFGRTAISELSLDAAAEPGQVILRRLDATVDGVHAIASGTIGAGGAVTEGHLALAAPGPAALANVLPAPFAARIGHWHRAFALNATAAGPPKHLKLTIKSVLGDLRWTASPIVNLDDGTWQGPISVRHPEAAQLMATSGLTDPIGWLGPGSLSLVGDAADGPLGWSLGGFRLNAGLLRVSGSLEDRGGSEITGRVRAIVLPVPPPGAALNQLLLGLVGARRMSLALDARRVTAGERIVLEGAKGFLDIGPRQGVLEVNGNVPGGGALALVLRVSGGAGPPHFRLGAAGSGIRLKGGLTEGVPDLEAGTLAGEASLTAQGYGPAALLATLGGSVSVTVRNGVLSGLSMAQMNSALAGGGSAEEFARSLAQALAGGRSPFTRLEVIAHGRTGRFRLMNARMVTAEGLVTADGMVDLPARSEALRLAIRPAIVGAPELVLRLGGPITRPKRIQEVNAALQWDQVRASEKGSAHQKHARGP
ncbi:MAG: AsmA family protein [Acetobacteraceae bacterium]